MAKALKTAALVVGAVALVATGVGAVALPGFAGALTVAGISTGTLFLVSGGLTVAASLLQKTPKVPASQTDRLSASVNPGAFRHTVLGQTAMPVEVRYEEWSGKDQEYCDWIVLHASHACEAIDEIWFETTMAWSRATGVVGKYVGYFTVPHIILDGSPANAFTLGSGKWSRGARLTGCAYSHWRFKLTGNSKKAESPFVSGMPSRITVIGRGAKLYDPRRDSTVPGGNGPMRADDQSTWRFTTDDGVTIGENLPLQILRVVLGWRIRNPSTGTLKLATGSGVPPRRINLASIAIAANLADEMVNRSAGGQEPRYHGAGVVSEGDDPKTVLDMLCTACCARFRDTGGKLSLVVAHNDLAAAATEDGLNDDDVVGAFTWDPDAALEATPNVVRGKYVDATTNSLYQLIDYPEIRLPSLDGQDRIFPLDLGVVESPSQAQRIAKQVLQRKQYPREFSAPFDIRAWKYGVGDVVPFTFAALGFDRALFRIKDQELGQGGVCNMTLTVESAAIYTWDADDAAPVQPAESIVYDSRNNPLILAIDDAAKTADWDAVSDPTGTKPANNADVTGDNVAKDTANVGGVPSAEVVQSLGKLPAIAADLDELAKGAVLTDDALGALARAGVDRDAAQRVLAHGSDVLAEAALRLTLDANRRAEAMRDAGIIIDPASGKARLFAVEEVAARSTMLEITLDAQAGQIRNRATYAEIERAIAEAQLEGAEVDLSGIYSRVSDAETLIDALNGEIVNRTTTTEFNKLGLTVSEVEQRLKSFGDEVGVSTDIRKVRRMTDEAAAATLGGLLSQDRAGRADRIAIVQARQELTVRMDDGDAIQARAATRLAVALDQVDARLVQESRARVAAGEVVAEDIRALSVTTDDQTGAIADLAKATIDQDRGMTVIRSTQRQQGALDDQTAEAMLTSLIAGDQADRRSRVQMVQAQSELATELVRGEVSRAAERVALDARLANANASAARSAEALAEADRATAKTVSDLSAKVSDPITGLPAAFASVGKMQEAVSDLDKTTARSIEILTAKFGDLGVATVQDLIEATVEATGKITATRTVAIDVNGNLVGTQLVGSEEGRGSLNLVNADLRMGTGRVIFNNGTYMQVQGVAFGVARDLLEWFGPTMNVAQCNRSNAIAYKTIDGDAYFGGSLSAGILRNASTSSGLSVNELAQIGPFGSNGRPVKYVASWAYRTQTRAIYAATPQGLQSYKAAAARFNAVDGFGTRTVENAASSIVLTRAVAGGGFEQLDQRSFTSQIETFSGSEPTPGDAPGSADITTSIGGGFTINDPVQSAFDRTVRLTLTRGFTAFGDAVSQRLSVIATEE
jgi:hypothetical protein